MTAFTTADVRDTSLVSEADIRVVHLTGGPNYTYTPSNPASKTILIISCYDLDSAGDAVKVTQSSGVLTIDNGGSTTTKYCLTYALV